MAQAGTFNESFTLLYRHTSKSTTGQDVETFLTHPVGVSSSPTVTVLWGELESIDGTEATEYGAIRSQSSARITLRQFVSIDAKDRLEHRNTGAIYVIDGVRKDRSTNTTVIDAHEFQDTELTDV